VNDKVTCIGNSTLHHGKYNDRIYLMKLSKDDFPEIIEKIDKLALAEKYSKIISKVPSFARDEFTKNGYIIEAFIPQFYNGCEDVYFMGKFLNEKRKFSFDHLRIEEILKVCISKSSNKRKRTELPSGFDCKICDKSDAYQVSEVYRTVFETYPFPISKPQYIMKTMDENFIYFSIRENDRIVALSSTEMDYNHQNVEMTDFATLPEYRENGLAIYLLQEMESKMKMQNMKTAYTIARSASYGINIIFVKSGYKYSGTLVSNTNISGNFESMNVWYKFL